MYQSTIMKNELSLCINLSSSENDSHTNNFTKDTRRSCIIHWCGHYNEVIKSKSNKKGFIPCFNIIWGILWIFLLSWLLLMEFLVYNIWSCWKLEKKPRKNRFYVWNLREYESWFTLLAFHFCQEPWLRIISTYIDFRS